MKIFFLTFVLLCLVNVAKAQFALTANGSGAYALGDFGSNSPFGYGGGAGLHYFFQDQGAIGLNVNYFNFAGKELIGGIKSPDTQMIAVTPSMMFLFFMDNSPYLTVDLGAYFLNGGGKSSVAGGGAVGLGYLYGFSDTIALNINAKYTAAYDFDTKSVGMFVPINLGLLFILGGTGQSQFR